MKKQKPMYEKGLMVIVDPLTSISKEIHNPYEVIAQEGDYIFLKSTYTGHEIWEKIENVKVSALD